MHDANESIRSKPPLFKEVSLPGAASAQPHGKFWRRLTFFIAARAARPSESPRRTIGRQPIAALADVPLQLSPVAFAVTSALDAENEELVRAYMQSQAGKKTILVISHRISTVRQADKIALIEGGSVKAVGTHEDLMCGSDYYECVATLQLVS